MRIVTTTRERTAEEVQEGKRFYHCDFVANLIGLGICKIVMSLRLSHAEDIISLQLL